MNRPNGNPIIPPGYEPTDADMANPVVHSLCNMLKYTESKLQNIQRAQKEYEIVTETQMSRLRIKLADTKLRLQDAKDGIRDLERRTTGVLCNAVIELQNRQRLVTTQKEYSCGICLDLLNSPDVFVQCGHSYCHTCILGLLKASSSPLIDPTTPPPSCPSCRRRVTEVPIANYGLETAVEALINAKVFPRAPTVKRLPDDYKRYFPKNLFDHTPRSSRAGVHRRSRGPRRNRFNPRSHHSRPNQASEDEWDQTGW
ncbi:hypothetical protein B0H16DRAFT_1469529 [Mycena metata]|uniref:RING-type domain-containing protein n=1 Tax=Mycena metata TaxID=1033252 RepID=A0AAD7MKJ1_9AGAR|nr:hypothetical protein B0H16DRAFT_1473764 [Mycena metata]KAJ7730555.1 hypothetical protein B0H16DRAFT_1469529 [Mycena metata]